MIYSAAPASGLTFRGRPRGRNATCKPSRSAIRRFHRSAPRGTPRAADCRTTFNAFSAIGRLTSASQFRGRSTGQDLTRPPRPPPPHPPRPQTAPPPVLRPSHQARPKCVRLNVPAYDQKVNILLNRKTPESPLVQRPLPHRATVSVPAVSVRHRHPLHPGREVRPPGGPDHQMPVIGHQTIGQQLRSIRPVQPLHQHPLKRRIVPIPLKDRQPHHPSVQQVIHNTRLGDPRRSPHEPMLAPPPPLSRKPSPHPHHLTPPPTALDSPPRDPIIQPLRFITTADPRERKEKT